MASIKTKFVGLDIKSPVIVAAGPNTADIDHLLKCEEAGAGAVVLKSLFQEHMRRTGSFSMVLALSRLAHTMPIS